jgi:hypothetical protein
MGTSKSSTTDTPGVITAPTRRQQSRRPGPAALAIYFSQRC